MRKSRLIGTAITIAAIGFVPALSAKKAPRLVWQVARSSDPITGATSCIVAAYDQASGISYTRTGALYPFVENSSTHGVLVGVGSGGRFRTPTGDIVWRVDGQPYRTLSAADNPAGATVSAIPPGNAAMQQLIDQQMRLVAAATATGTVAGGDTARAMLKEMLAGSGLVFRAAAATAGYGLPTGADRRVGLLTKNGIRPYPLDESFRAGLISCGVPVAVSTSAG